MSISILIAIILAVMVQQFLFVDAQTTTTTTTCPSSSSSYTNISQEDYNSATSEIESLKTTILGISIALSLILFLILLFCVQIYYFTSGRQRRATLAALQESASKMYCCCCSRLSHKCSSSSSSSSSSLLSSCCCNFFSSFSSSSSLTTRIDLDKDPHQLEANARDCRRAPCDSNIQISILFTDIEAASQLWKLAPDEMELAFSTHCSIIRQIICQYKAFEVKMIGDSFMVAIVSPVAAVKMAMEMIQSNDDAEDKPSTEVAQVIRETYSEKIHPLSDDSVELRNNAKRINQRYCFSGGSGDGGVNLLKKNTGQTKFSRHTKLHQQIEEAVERNYNVQTFDQHQAFENKMSTTTAKSHQHSHSHQKNNNHTNATTAPSLRQQQKEELLRQRQISQQSVLEKKMRMMKRKGDFSHNNDDDDDDDGDKEHIDHQHHDNLFHSSSFGNENLNNEDEAADVSIAPKFDHEAVLRMRCGIHVGHCKIVHQSETNEYDYVGETVEIAARLEKLAHGHQLLVSKELVEQLRIVYGGEKLMEKYFFRYLDEFEFTSNFLGEEENMNNNSNNNSNNNVVDQFGESTTSFQNQNISNNSQNSNLKVIDVFQVDVKSADTYLCHPPLRVGRARELGEQDIIHAATAQLASATDLTLLQQQQQQHNPHHQQEHSNSSHSTLGNSSSGHYHHQNQSRVIEEEEEVVDTLDVTARPLSIEFTSPSKHHHQNNNNSNSNNNSNNHSAKSLGNEEGGEGEHPTYSKKQKKEQQKEHQQEQELPHQIQHHQQQQQKQQYHDFDDQEQKRFFEIQEEKKKAKIPHHETEEDESHRHSKSPQSRSRQQQSQQQQHQQKEKEEDRRRRREKHDDDHHQFDSSLANNRSEQTVANFFAAAPSMVFTPGSSTPSVFNQNTNNYNNDNLLAPTTPTKTTSNNSSGLLGIPSASSFQLNIPKSPLLLSTSAFCIPTPSSSASSSHRQQHHHGQHQQQQLSISILAATTTSSNSNNKEDSNSVFNAFVEFTAKFLYIALSTVPRDMRQKTLSAILLSWGVSVQNIEPNASSSGVFSPKKRAEKQAESSKRALAILSSKVLRVLKALEQKSAPTTSIHSKVDEL